jgi:feruloyl-CoA synthase
MAWRDAVLAGLRAANEAAGGGSSRRIVRALALAQPPSLDANEVTDKGSLNVRAIATRRAADIERLYAGGAEVMLP